jgi:predicted DNA-binding transcriptional regulator AlpA
LTFAQTMAMLEHMAKLIGSAEAAQILGIHRSVLNKRIRSGGVIPSQKLPGSTGAYLFERSDIESIAGAQK